MAPGHSCLSQSPGGSALTREKVSPTSSCSGPKPRSVLRSLPYFIAEGPPVVNPANSVFRMPPRSLSSLHIHCHLPDAGQHDLTPGFRPSPQHGSFPCWPPCTPHSVCFLHSSNSNLKNKKPQIMSVSCLKPFTALRRAPDSSPAEPFPVAPTARSQHPHQPP